MTSSWYALRVFDEAISRTKDLLLPFDLGIWLRLAIISFFVGGSGGGSTGNIAGNGEEFSGLAPVSIGFPTLIIGLILAILLIVFIFMFLSAVFQFVFVDCLASNQVSLSRTFSLRAGKGVRLLLFTIGAIAVFIATIAALFLITFGSASLSGEIANVIAFIYAIPILILLAILFGIVMLLTTDFVVPVMITDDCGVIEAWSRVLSFIRKDWGQTFVYLLAKFLIGIGIFILMFILILIAVVLLLIPFGILAVVLVGFLKMTLLVLIGLAIPAILILFVVIFFISVPFTTFVRYYSLLVLGQFAPEYDLLPHQTGEESQGEAPI